MRVLGEEYPDTLTSMNNLAFTFRLKAITTRLFVRVMVECRIKDICYISAQCPSHDAILLSLQLLPSKSYTIALLLLQCLLLFLETAPKIPLNALILYAAQLTSQPSKPFALTSSIFTSNYMFTRSTQPTYKHSIGQAILGFGIIFIVVRSLSSQLELKILSIIFKPSASLNALLCSRSLASNLDAEFNRLWPIFVVIFRWLRPIKFIKTVSPWLGQVLRSFQYI